MTNERDRCEPTAEAYLNLLAPWAKTMQQDLIGLPERPDLLCYGPGLGHWGAQTAQKACGALAVLALAPERWLAEHLPDEKEQLLPRACRLLRFILESHIAGPYQGLDGNAWGHTWISALGLERMMHGVLPLVEQLSAKEQDLFRRVMLSEADWLLDAYSIPAGLTTNNRPESNLWNGSFLHRIAALYPEHARAAAYRSKGDQFLANAISVPSDRVSLVQVGERTLAELFVDANFFPSFALNHHGYLNVGYMVICLSNMAMLHFFYREQGLEPPELLYHHGAELWQLVSECLFPDGRLLRIGGDTRVRYGYCQDYAIPVWLLVQDWLGDTRGAAWEAGWLDLVAEEMAHNGDDTFLSARCGHLRDLSPLYFTRLESDRAVTLSMGAWWRRQLHWPAVSKSTGPLGKQRPFQWEDSYHGASFHRSGRRIASFTWVAGEAPQGLCLPPEDSSLAEWRENLAGQVTGLGRFHFNELVTHSQHSFPGGFLTYGSFLRQNEGFLAEGQNAAEVLACQKLFFAALPDDQTVVVLQYGYTPIYATIAAVKGLFLQVPNDLFNHAYRRYYSEAGSFMLEGGAYAVPDIVDLHSTWLNVADQLGVTLLYGAPSLSIRRPGERQISLKEKPSSRPQAGGMLYADEICCGLRLEQAVYPAGSVLFDIGCVLQAGVNRGQTREYAALVNSSNVGERGNSGDPKFRVVEIPGADGRTYVAAFNLHDVGVAASLTVHGQLRCLVTGRTLPHEAGGVQLSLAGNSGGLYVQEPAEDA